MKTAGSDILLRDAPDTLPEPGAVNADTATSHVEPRCLLCGKPGRMTLLTSMTRYYACERCRGRWQIARLGEETSPGHVLATPNV